MVLGPESHSSKVKSAAGRCRADAGVGVAREHVLDGGVHGSAEPFLFLPQRSGGDERVELAGSPQVDHRLLFELGGELLVQPLLGHLGKLIVLGEGPRTDRLSLPATRAASGGKRSEAFADGNDE